jgi:hypothetical protein
MCPKRNQPPDGIMYRSKVWRYMSFAKFASMLSRNELHFSRIDRLDDQLEGMLSPRTVAAYVRDLLASEQVQATLRGRVGINPEEIARLSIGTSDMVMRAKTFVNCWYLSETESSGMWQSYGKDGIAVQSTWKRLTESLADDVAVGQIQYVDCETDLVHPRVPFLYKDKIFEGEREIRMMVRRVPRESSILGFNQDHPVGVGVPANLDRLIRRIYVAPRSGSWFKETVETLLAKYGLSRFAQVMSQADGRPIRGVEARFGEAEEGEGGPA